MPPRAIQFVVLVVILLGGGGGGCPVGAGSCPSSEVHPGQNFNMNCPIGEQFREAGLGTQNTSIDFTVNLLFYSRREL